MPSPRLLTLADVRLDGGHVIAAPTWAFEQRLTSRGGVKGYYPIPALWEKVNEERRRRFAAEKAERERRGAARRDDTSIEGQRLRQLEAVISSLGNQRSRGMSVTTDPERDGYSCDGSWKHCRECRAVYVGWGTVKFCTDACAAVRKAKTLEKAKAREKANPRVRRVSHPPRNCFACSKSFIPKRSDAKFCSGKCRVRHHRS